MPRKKPSPSFTSFRILGKRAQDLLTRASQELRAKKDQKAQRQAELPEQELVPDISVRFSLINIAQTAFVLLAIAVGAWMAVVLRDKIILLLLGFFVAAIIDPGVRMMERGGLPRGVGILIHYFFALFIVLFLLISLIPIIATQLKDIALLISEQVNRFLDHPQIYIPFVPADVNVELSKLVEATLRSLSINKFTDALQTMSQNMSSIAQGSVLFATRLAGSVVNFFVRLVVVLVLAFFIQIEKEHIRLWIRSFFSSRYKSYIDSRTDAVHLKIGQWARGQLLLGLSIGLLVYIALKILGMPYAATLAVLAGFTEFIPYVGPFIAAIPSVLIALTQGGWLWACIVAGVYYVIQWSENNMLVPLIMKRAVGLSPIAIIFAMLMGLSFPDLLHPVLGMLLAVPFTTIVAIFLEDWRTMRKNASS